MKKLLVVLCLITLAAPAALAAGRGVVSGKVTDAAGDAVAGATVRVVSRSGVGRAAATDRDGAYSIDGLVAGAYLVEVSALGFRTETREVRLADASQHAVDVELDVAAVSEEVTITAAGTPQSRDEVAKAIDVVTGDEAEARQEVALPEALTTVAGLRVQRQGGPGALTGLRFRGLRSQDTSVLVDDLRVRDASDLYGSLLSFYEDLLLTDVDRIEIVRGAGSTIYGSHAVGGVINLIPARGAGAPVFDALVEGGSLGTVHGRFTSSGGTDRFDYSAGLDQYHVADGVDGDDEYRATSVVGRAGFRLTDTAELTGRLLLNDSRVALNGNPFFAGIGGGSVFPPDPVRFLDAPNDPDDRREGRLLEGALGFQHAVNDVWSYTVRYAGNSTRREFRYGAGSDPAFYDLVAPATFDYDGDGQPDVSGTGDLDYRGSVHTVDMRNRVALGRTSLLTAGLEVERESFSQYFPGPFGTTRQDFNIFGFDYDFDGVNDASRDSQWTYAVFAYDQLSLLDGRLQLGLGARWQGFRVGDTEALLGTANLVMPDNARTQVVPAELQGVEERSAVTGDGSIAYSFVSTGTRVWAHVGNSFRAPSLYERFSNVADTSLVGSGLLRAGDPTLKPETSISVDGGVEQRAFGDRLRVGATYFYTKLQRQIDYASFFNPETFEVEDPLGLGRFGGFVNTSGGLSRGLEVTAAATPFRSLALKAAYTFTNSDVVLPSAIALASGEVVGRGASFRAPGIPEHTFALQAVERIGRLTIAFDLVAVSEHDAQLFDPISFGSRRFTFDGYAKADLAASYTIPVTDRVALSIFGRVENLTDAEILENGLRLPGATGTGGVKVRF
jgi:vitamin B12 transporter